MTTFNIGLNNNPKDTEQITEMVNKLVGRAPLKRNLYTGEYKGEVEPTLVLTYENERLTRVQIQKLCEDTTQEAIALKRDGKGRLVFNPNYKGRKFTFNQDYFIEP
jgi:hypothetical protein